jgi:hypothetical protein
MNAPELIGLEANTPDGRGFIHTLLPNGVVIQLHGTPFKKELHGRLQASNQLHYLYHYEVVEIVKGRTNFKPN